jgi:hypothetical protein
MQRVVACASWEARHSEGCKSSGAAMDSEQVMIGRDAKVLYEYTVLFDAGFGKPRSQPSSVILWRLKNQAAAGAGSTNSRSYLKK